MNWLLFAQQAVRKEAMSCRAIVLGPACPGDERYVCSVYLPKPVQKSYMRNERPGGIKFPFVQLGGVTLSLGSDPTLKKNRQSEMREATHIIYLSLTHPPHPWDFLANQSASCAPTAGDRDMGHGHPQQDKWCPL